MRFLFRWTFIPALMLLLAVTAILYADYSPGSYTKLAGFSIGAGADLNINRARINLNVTSPWLLENYFGFRASIGLDGFQARFAGTSTSNSAVWVGYNTFKLGVLFSPGFRLDWIRPYGEFGFQGTLENNQMSANQMGLGFYQVLGFDLMISPSDPFAWYLELGAAGMVSGGVASKATSIVSLTGDTLKNFDGTANTNIANGFTVSFGVRFYPF